MKKEINAYLALSDRDFDAGLELLKQYNKNNHLHLLVVRLGQSRLETEMKKLLADEAQAEEEATAGKEKKPKAETTWKVSKKKEEAPVVDINTTSKETPDGKQALIEEYEAKLAEITKGRNDLSNMLADQKTDEDRKVVVDQILAKRDEFNEVKAKMGKLTSTDHIEDVETPGEVIAKTYAPDVASQLLVLKKELLSARGKETKTKRDLKTKPDNKVLLEKLATATGVKKDLELKIKVLEGTN